MPRTRNFKELSDSIRQDPDRARKIDALKAELLAEQRAYQIAELRKALGVTQVELAALISRSQSAVSQIENGEVGLSIDLLRLIVSELGGTLEVTAVFDDRRIALRA